MNAELVRRWTAFNLVGIAGMALQLGAIALLVRVCGWHYLAATAVAVEAAVLHNFAWHQRWTWRDRPASSWGSAAARFLRFHVLNGAISLVGNLTIMALLAGHLHAGAEVANVVAIAACATLNFVASDGIVFRSTAPLLGLVLFVGLPAPAAAQSAPALAGWEGYVSALDARYAAAGSAGAFFTHDGEIHDGEAPRGWREAVRGGAVSVIKIDAPAVSGGKVHHWVAAAFVPGISLKAFIAQLKHQAGRESELYEDVVASKLLARDGDRLRVFMKLRRTTLITVTYNTEHAVEYRTLGEARASARSVATKIVELGNAGTEREREKAQGADNGFLWRLNAYWRYEASDGGVLVECESVSLSRPVPLLVRPLANSIIDRIAGESLERTLRSLRAGMPRS